MTPAEYEAGLLEILAFIQGRRFPFAGPGLTSYKGDDPDSTGLHQACLELERRGHILRHFEDDRMIIWKPHEDNSL